MSWKETAEAFGTSWDKVYSAVQHAVFWGVLRRSLTKIKTIGVDENLTDKQAVKLSELLSTKLTTVRCRIMWKPP